VFAHACRLGAEGIVSKSTAPIGLVRARSGSRSGIPPALRCSGSVATIGTDDLEAGALSFGLNV